MEVGGLAYLELFAPCFAIVLRMCGPLLSAALFGGAVEYIDPKSATHVDIAAR